MLHNNFIEKFINKPLKSLEDEKKNLENKKADLKNEGDLKNLETEVKKFEAEIKILEKLKVTLNQVIDEKNDSLNLYNHHLTDKHIVQIITPFLNQYPNVTTVDLSVNAIGDDGAEKLSETSITHLNVDENMIGDEGAKALAHGNLTELSINHNRVEDEGIAALAFAVKDKIYSLSKLSSYGNPGSAVEADIRKEKDPNKQAALRSKLGAIPTLKDMSIYQTKKSNKSPDDLPDVLKSPVEKKKFK